MLRKSRCYIALLHYPMYNKQKSIITTSVTNLDLHDISRVARTYEVEGFFVVHPYVQQQELINEIINYWTKGYGGKYNPDRHEAFKRLQLASSLDEVDGIINDQCGKMPLHVVTDAKSHVNSISYLELKKKLWDDDRPYLILFGTGWGMADELISGSDYILEPIDGVGDYNHLSVRSAVAIIIDRLLGNYWFIDKDGLEC